MSKEEQSGFVVSFELGDVEFGPASYDVWAEYLQKLREGESEAGDRGLVLACCSLGTDERSGEHELAPYLDQSPAALADIAAEIEAISGGDVKVTAGDRAVKVDGLTFSSPNAREWSTYQANLKDESFKGGKASKTLLAEMVDDKDAFEAFIVANPAALGYIIQPISKLAGRGIKITRKKA